MKKIMIVGASILQLPAIKKAKQMGLSVIAVDINPDAVGFREEGVIREVISTIDIPAVLEAAKSHKIDGIMTLASDMPMRTIAKVSKELGLVGIDEETAWKATNKAMMRDALALSGVSIPAYHKASCEREFIDAVNFLRDRGYECIIKPADNSGSRGVDLLKDYSEESLQKAYQYSREYSRSGDVIVEEFMDGLEVSVETLTVDGVCHVIQITDKLTTGAPYFVEMGHSQPSALPKDTQRKIREAAIAANKAIGITSGPSHTEIKVTKDGPKIVELGARLGGDNITTHLVPLSTGVDMVEGCIKIALGEKPEINRKIEKASAIRYIKSDVGIIKDIIGIDAAKQIKGINQICIVHGIGEQAVEVRSSVDRIGFVIAQENTVIDAVKACESAINEIKVEIETEG